MALVMQLWEERRGEERRCLQGGEGLFAKKERVSTLDMQIQDQLCCQHLNP
jgi:hypothetical protein